MASPNLEILVPTIATEAQYAITGTPKNIAKEICLIKRTYVIIFSISFILHRYGLPDSVD